MISVCFTISEDIHRLTLGCLGVTGRFLTLWCKCLPVLIYLKKTAQLLSKRYVCICGKLNNHTTEKVRMCFSVVSICLVCWVVQASNKFFFLLLCVHNGTPYCTPQDNYAPTFTHHFYSHFNITLYTFFLPAGIFCGGFQVNIFVCIFHFPNFLNHIIPRNSFTVNVLSEEDEVCHFISFFILLLGQHRILWHTKHSFLLHS